MRQKKFWVGFLFLVSLLMFPYSSFACQTYSLTPEQQQDVLRAKARTQKAIATWDNQISHQPDRKSSSGIKAQAAIGLPGDILVTLDGTSSGSLSWAGGHAAVVSDLSGYTVESFGNKGDLNGVRHWINDWTTRYEKVKGLRVSGASNADYSYAASYARAQIGKPYNYNFFNIETTSSFYCSQLVWRAFYNRGFDLNDGWAVWPVDLVESPLTYAFYSQG
ncbi:YiiX/YebB-like N1pC/P60 family cysteine hydrolase [Thermoactinomyces mirandus]|uniref:Permuted papain-like amidase enzyme, YaeF/YiiX, C92 family n=1 Tax=Thermoactinomyces mirandus TaxID=2756294 RepID=A0A7W1XQ43_9BACL|nr:YiiX/YebB-like N1pC/P60 family cysteine hydrolase [Thermoactinomyces mirandus]MBA4600985.1 hypothetical protein [Thermoactinomyces mirandus]